MTVSEYVTSIGLTSRCLPHWTPSSPSPSWRWERKSLFCVLQPKTGVGSCQNKCKTHNNLDIISTPYLPLHPTEKALLIRPCFPKGIDIFRALIYAWKTVIECLLTRPCGGSKRHVKIPKIDRNEHNKGVCTIDVQLEQNLKKHVAPHLFHGYPAHFRNF